MSNDVRKNFKKRIRRERILAQRNMDQTNEMANNILAEAYARLNILADKAEEIILYALQQQTKSILVDVMEKLILSDDSDDERKVI